LCGWPGILFGFVLGTATAQADDAGGTGPVASTLLLVVAVVFLLGAARKLLDAPDEDAPSPSWMALVRSAPPVRALALGAGVVALSPKLWAFTLGAIAAIAEAGLGQGPAVAVFLGFVVLAESVHLSLVGVAIADPARSA
jgi:hypothetical protein